MAVTSFFFALAAAGFLAEGLLAFAVVDFFAGDEAMEAAFVAEAELLVTRPMVLQQVVLE